MSFGAPARPIAGSSLCFASSMPRKIQRFVRYFSTRPASCDHVEISSAIPVHLEIVSVIGAGTAVPVQYNAICADRARLLPSGDDGSPSLENCARVLFAKHPYCFL